MMQVISTIRHSLAIRRVRDQSREVAARVQQYVKDDWHADRFLPVGLFVLAATSLFVIAFYINHPRPELLADTPTYLQVTQRILTQGNLMDAERMPGYPFLIAVIFGVFGSGNLTAVSIAQCLLFVLAVLEIYALGYLILHRTWAAAAISLLVATNVYLLAAVKPILSEAIALWLVVTLTLAVALCVRSLLPRDVWIVTALVLVTILTRAEWMFLPLPLFAYLLILALRRGQARTLLPHIVAATLILYAVMLGYAALTAREFGFFGVTDKRPVQSLGKVMQYRMQNEAPPEYASVAAIVNGYVSQGVTNPAVVLEHEPRLAAYYFALAGDYSTAIIERHPLEFLKDSVPFELRSLSFISNYYPNAGINAAGPFAPLLMGFRSLMALLFRLYELFPFVGLLWFLMLISKRTARLPTVETMGAVVLVSLYSIATTAVATYSYTDAARVQSAVDPLLTLVIFGTGVLGAITLKRVLPEIASSLRGQAPRITLPPDESTAAAMQIVHDEVELTPNDAYDRPQV